jgi:hypothetical protein
MGKIRSTLDIVMEKTKNLSMTRDDKESLRHKELAVRARAAVRKYLDVKATLQDMRSELDSSGEERPDLLALVKQDLLQNIQIDGDNLRVLDALENLCGVDREKVREHIGTFRARLDAEMANRLAELKADLEGKGIRGSAVIPNIARDKAWQNMLSRARQLLSDELGDIL